MKRKYLTVIPGILLICAFFSAPLFAAKYYISTTGSNTSGDGTRSNPYATLNHISRYVMTPGLGDTIVFMEGAHGSQIAGYNHQFRGSPGNYIVIMGDPEASTRPMISGGGTTIPNTQYGLAIKGRYSEPTNNIPEDDVQYIKIYGIDFENCYQCITMDDAGYPDAAHDSRSTPAHHLIIENCTFGNSRNPIKWAGVDTFLVKDCDFYNHTNACIDLVGCHYGTVIGCIFRDRMVFEQGSGLDIKGGSKDVTVAKCYFRDMGMYGLVIGQMTGASFFRPAFYVNDSDGNLVDYESKDINVYACIFDNMQMPVRFATSRGGKIYNNTIYMPTNYSGGLPAGAISAFNLYAFHTDPRSNGTEILTRTRDGSIKNNIICYARTWGYSDRNPIWWASSAHTIPTSFQLSNNLWHSMYDPSVSMPYWDFYDQYIYGAPQHQNDFLGYPEFVSADPQEPGHFQLQEGSPAAGRGVPITNEIFDFFNGVYLDGTDYFGQPWTNPPALGAFGVSLEGIPPVTPAAHAPMPAELD